MKVSPTHKILVQMCEFEKEIAIGNGVRRMEEEIFDIRHQILDIRFSIFENGEWGIVNREW